jgi:hypothetical protein
MATRPADDNVSSARTHPKLAHLPLGMQQIHELTPRLLGQLHGTTMLAQSAHDS